ncbi:hypothetical protein B0H10DRAFT_2232329 [Mycena sp. CBHHK59/15]|nr:hypothetical protein B0H10DRAFT_2232329 [Mycena sp. CBHHK59/15]
MNHQELSFHDEFPWLWDGLSQQQPLAPYRDPVAFEPYPNVYPYDDNFQFYIPPVHPAPNAAPLHIPLAHTLVPVPALDVPAPKPKPKRAQGSAKAPKEPDELKYTARNLRDIVETAIEVELFTAKHGEKGKKLSEFGAAVRKLGIEGSDAVLKQRLLEVLTYHEDPARAPAAIVKAITGTEYEIRLGAPLDQLAAQRRAYADKTDAQKDKMLKEAAENKRGGNMIRNASMVASRRTAAARVAEESADDDVVVLDNPAPALVTTPVASTPAAPLRSLPPLREDRTPPPPALLLDHKFDSEDDEEIECTGHNLPTREAAITPVIIKSECALSTIPSTTVEKSVPKKRVKLETPVSSIPRGSRKSSSNKHAKDDDSDIENSPLTTRKTKRVRRNTSFDLEGHLLEERKLRLEERKHRAEFEARLLGQVRQSNAEFSKLAESTQTFQTEFLGILNNVFKN